MQYSLGRRRMAEIKASVERGEYFPCHKTTGPRHSAECEAGGWDHVDAITKLLIITKEQACQGAILWQNERRAPLDDE